MCLRAGLTQDKTRRGDPWQNAANCSKQSEQMGRFGCECPETEYAVYITLVKKLSMFDRTEHCV